MENFYDVRKIYGQVLFFFLDARKSLAGKSTSGSGGDPPGDGWNRAKAIFPWKFFGGKQGTRLIYHLVHARLVHFPSFFLSSFPPLSSFSLSIPFYARWNFISTRTRPPRRHLVASRWKNLAPRAWNTNTGKFSALTYFPGSGEGVEKWCLARVASCRNL